MATQTTYTVTGMTCGGCAGKVTSHVENLPGVLDTDVDLTTGNLTITSDKPLNDDTVQHAVEQAGYHLAT